MYIRSLDKSGNFTTHVGWEQFFDPRFNDRWMSSTDTIWTVKEWLSFYNRLMCPENFRQFDFFQHVMFDGTWANEAEYHKFLELSALVPEDLRWTFAFLRRRGRINNENSELQLMVPLAELYQINPVAARWRNERITTPSTPEEFKNFVERGAAEWKQLLADREGCIHMTCGEIPSSNYLLSKINYFTAGYKYCATSDGYQRNPKYISSNLTADSSIKVTITSDRSTEVSLVEPVSVRNRRNLYKIHYYSTNVLDYLPYPNKLKHETDPVLVGVELEVKTDYDIKQLVDAAEEPFFLAKADSSITGDKANAMELVTAPSSFKYLKRQYALWFSKLDYMKFDVTTRTSNGMHVHIGKDHFDNQTHIRNFCWFLNDPANFDFLLVISERGSITDFRQWSAQYNFNQIRHNGSRVKCFKELYNYLGNIRGITNTHKNGMEAKTVEVRMFRGVVSYASIVKNLEFVEAVFEFTRELTSYRDLTLKGFLSWLDKTQTNRFTLLKKFIEKSFNREKEIANSEIKTVIFNLTDNEKILEAVKKSGLKLTHLHIEALNKGKKRTFFIDKHTGQLSMIIRNRGKLYEFDKSFAERYLRNNANSDKVA